MNKLILISLVMFFSICSKSWADQELSQINSQIMDKLRSIAANNYPKAALKRLIEGKVHLIFQLNEDGSLKKVEIGPKNKAPEVLRKSAISALKQSLPISNSDLNLKDKIFEVYVIYEINKDSPSKDKLKAD